MGARRNPSTALVDVKEKSDALKGELDGKQQSYFVISRLSEVLVPQADSHEVARHVRAHDFVRLFLQCLACLTRSDGRGDRESRRPLRPDRPCGHTHRGASREAIVHQNYMTSFDSEGSAIAAIERLLPRNLGPFADDGFRDVAFRRADRADDVFVHDADVTRSDGAHGQLLVTGHAKLADKKHVERQVQRPGDFSGDGHTAAGKTQNNCRGDCRLSAKSFRQDLTGFGTIPVGAHDAIIALSVRTEARRNTEARS